jgi:hypothetical protein
MNERCACRCSCGDYRARDCSDLCADCWRLWCLAEGGHGPAKPKAATPQLALPMEGRP